MRSARLYGRDHHTVGALAAVAEGPAAITLSRGGYAKQYDHTEANEDAVSFAFDTGGTFLAVADGHHGASGAQAVIRYLEAEYAARWTAPADIAPSDSAWRDESGRALAGANHAILAAAAERSLPPAPTTLALCVIRPGEGRVLWAGIGDSHAFAVDHHTATDLLLSGTTGQRRSFLGYESTTAAGISARAVSGTTPLTPLRAFVLATDGLSERGIGVDDPAAAVLSAVRDCAGVDAELRPLAVARRVSNAAMQAHRAHSAGDNMASAVAWAGD